MLPFDVLTFSTGQKTAKNIYNPGLNLINPSFDYGSSKICGVNENLSFQFYD